MKLRLNIRQLPTGSWAHFSGKNYWADTIAPTAREARILALYGIGREAQAKIDAVDRELKRLGAYDERDPHGYLA